MKYKNNLIVVRLSKLTILLVVFIVTCGSSGSVVQYDKDDPSFNHDNFAEKAPLTRVIDGDIGKYGENIITSKRNFSGIADMTIQYYRYDPFSGKDVFVEKKQYRYSVYIFTKAPLKVGFISESNPFNISIYPNRDSSTVKEGYIDIRSAALCTVNTFRDLLLQYWNLTLIGEKLSGTLADTHIAEASAANLLWAWEDIASLKTIKPFPIATNTTIQGVITDTGLKLMIQGETTDTYRKFVVKIVGQRNRPNK